MLLQNNDLPLIYALPKGVNFWRIDWFGELAFPNRMMRRTQPSLLLHLSRVVDEKFQDDPALLLSPESTTPARYQRKAWVSVGTLPLLRIGDIWRDGKLEARPDYQLETFPDLQIDKSTTSLIKAGLNLNDKGFLLPLAEHPWHLHCTHSYCVMVELPGQQRLIIPCVELIRFYFGSSGNLITKLFMPPLERKALYSDAKFDKASGRLSLELAERISGASAADIGRIHMDSVAWRAALHIGTSALAASIARQSIYPQGLFPFDGETTLVATGKWLPLGDQPQSTFLVYSLRSCSHAFPFKSLRYESRAKNHEQQRRQKDSAQSGDRPYRSSPQDAPDQKVVEQDASSKLASKVKVARLEPRFPDLLKKAIWKSAPLVSSKDSPTPIQTKTQPVDRAAVGEPGSERRIRPIDLAVLTRHDSDHLPAPEFLRSSVEELKRLQGINVELLTQSEHDGWTVPVTMLSNEDGEINPGLLSDFGGDNLSLRRVAVFALKRDREHVSLVIVEAAPVHMKFYPTAGNDPEEIWATLQCASSDFLLRPESPGEQLGKLIFWIFDESFSPDPFGSSIATECAAKPHKMSCP
jgi:hypothetical protein